MAQITEEALVAPSNKSAELARQLWLEQASALLQPLSGLEAVQQELAQVQDQLQRRLKSVAVFGAFSSGKSSLINALLGQTVLTVSPNPTTAAITHVDRPTLAQPVSAAQVRAKTADQMWTDIKQALATMHLEQADLDAALTTPLSLTLGKLAPAARRAAAFLQAAQAGYGDMRSRLGQTWDVDSSDVKTYTADEKYACYVQEVTLHHDAPWLQQGIVLTDTPGVDSIHKRHTEVAFTYMRRADAIVFVLYYTHAFSRADKDFLMQLAGVQDVRGSDNLYVVINAVDLATDAQERLSVRDRVIAELRQLGIARPRVFEVSSQIGLAARMLADDAQVEEMAGLVRQRLRLTAEMGLPDVETLLEQSGITAFQQALTDDMVQSSDKLATAACLRLQARAAELVRGLWQAQQVRRSASDAERQALQLAWTALLEAWAPQRTRTRQVASSIDTQPGQEAQSSETASSVETTQPDEDALCAEWSELTYHIGERIRHRLGGLFREVYHPGRFRALADPKAVLRAAGAELCDTLSRQIELECRTLLLRMVEQANLQFTKVQKQLLDALSAQYVTANTGRFLGHEVVTDAFVQDHSSRVGVTLPLSLLDAVPRFFSTPKQFFEQGGQKEMIEGCSQAVMGAVRSAVEAVSSALAEGTLAAYRESKTELYMAASEQVERELQSVLNTSEWNDANWNDGDWATALQFFEHAPSFR